MATQTFRLDPSLAGLSPALLKKRYDQMTPEERRAMGFTRPATQQEFAAAQQSAPPEISADTDPGIPVTHLPNGVTFQKQNTTGLLPKDISNPPAADLAQTPMRTVGAQFNPNAAYEKESAESGSAKFDPTASYEKETASDSTAATPPEKPGFWERAYETSGAKGLIEQAKQRDQELRDMYSRVGQHLENGDVASAASELGQHVAKVAKQTVLDSPPVAIVRGQASQVPKAIEAAKAGHYSEAAGHALATVTPLGPQAADMGEKLGTDVGEGNYKGAAGDMAGFVGPMVAAKGVSALSEARPGVLSAPVRLAARASEAAANQKLVPVKPLLNIMTPADEAEALNFKVPGRDYGLPKAAPKLAAAPTPAELPEGFTSRQPYQEPAGSASNPFRAPNRTTEAPAASPAASQTPELEDFEGQASPQTENAAASPLESSPADVLGKKASPAQVKSMLEESLGAKPLKKGVSLKNQNQPTAAADTSLPKGFTPVESTALKGYKYSPETREFESITQGGQHYIHGDVSPEEAQVFEASESKGKAWQQIRNNPLVAKMVNGNRVAIIKGKSLLDMPPADALSQKLGNLQDFMGTTKAATETKAPISETKAPVSETQPLNVFRSRSMGEKGIPYNPESRAQATMSEAEGRRIMPNREDIEGKPQELIQTDLAKAPAFSVIPRGTSPSWIKFHAAIPEANVAEAAARAANVLDPGDLTALLKESLRQAKAKVKQ